MFPRGLLKEYARSLSVLLRCLDVIAVIVAGIIAYFYRFGHLQLTANYLLALTVAAFLTFAVFSWFQVYESVRAKNSWDYFAVLIKAILVVLLLLAGFAFFTKSGEQFSRGWYLYWVVASVSLLLFFRGSLLLFLRVMRIYRWGERYVIIIGAGRLGVRLAEALQQALWTGFRIVAIFDNSGVAHQSAAIGDVPIMSLPKDLSHYLTSSPKTIDEIWLALPMSEEQRTKQLLHELRHHTVTVRFVLDILGVDLLRHPITELAGFPTITLNASPMVGVNRLIKAVEDRLLAAIILILISPLFLLIAIGVKYSSKGPVFFKQLRHGWDGRIIKVYKFRTMTEHHEVDGKVTQATLNDKRITQFGKFLRKTSLDELPQFINVLQGRMSIVGPRPHAVSHNEFYKDSIHAYMQRHKVKPGITGWAQVNGLRGETDLLEKMEKRVEYDLYYIEHWSLWFDLKIILLTFLYGFVNSNAY